MSVLAPKLGTRVEPNIVLGMTIMGGTMLVIPVMDALAKYLGSTGNVAPAVVAFARFAFQGAVLFIVLLFLRAIYQSRRILPKSVAVNLLRGAMMAVASFLFFTAVTFMPIADAMAIFFVEPFILTILSAIFLGEKVGWRRRIAVLVGFGGALLVIQPSFEEFGWAALLPIGTAFIFANYLILTRKMATHDDPLAMQFVAGIGGAVMMFVLLSVGTTFNIDAMSFRFPETIFLWQLLLLVGVIGLVTHLLIVVAFARAPAAILAPFQYLEIVTAALLGYLFFNDFPNLIKWIGISIIVGSGIYIFIREAKLSKEEGTI